MEEARAVLARLKRIEALEREGAGVKPLLSELRELVREATEWAEQERDPRARAAAVALAEAERADAANPMQALHRSHEQAVPSAVAAAPIE
jgi:hypothetical protein